MLRKLEMLSVLLVFGMWGGASAELISYHPFNEGAGTTAADESGHGNDGTLSSGVEWVEGYQGGAVHLDTGTVRFLTDDEVERFTRFTLLKEYVQRKKAELEDYNARLDDPENANVNGRRLTNIGTFRAYIVNYLKHHSKIHQGMTLLVRQLSPGPSGVPIEIYVFTNDTAWVAYEDIQGDVFDHIMAIVPEFGLRLYQSPSGADVHQVVTHLTKSE